MRSLIAMVMLVAAVSATAPVAQASTPPPETLAWLGTFSVTSQDALTLPDEDPTLEIHYHDSWAWNGTVNPVADAENPGEQMTGTVRLTALEQSSEQDGRTCTTTLNSSTQVSRGAVVRPTTDWTDGTGSTFPGYALAFDAWDGDEGHAAPTTLTCTDEESSSSTYPDPLSDLTACVGTNSGGGPVLASPAAYLGVPQVDGMHFKGTTTKTCSWTQANCDCLSSGSVTTTSTFDLVAVPVIKMTLKYSSNTTKIRAWGTLTPASTTGSVKLTLARRSAGKWIVVQTRSVPITAGKYSYPFIKHPTTPLCRITATFRGKTLTKIFSCGSTGRL